MSEIKKITISGFRGINTPPLELDFKKGKSLQSMMIYGRNGSGKSSIVDAWEWLYCDRIEHLAREGAGTDSYQHKEAGDQQTYLEVEFADNETGIIKMEFDPDRKTKPIITGDITKLRERISHTCHLRYRDLSEFVYKTRAQKYEFLSKLMGFENAINIQNDLRKCSGELDKKLEYLLKDKKSLEDEYQQISGTKLKDAKSFIKIVNLISKNHGIASIQAVTEIYPSINKLKEEVEKDEKTNKLAQLKDIQSIINRFYPIQDINPDISKFQKELKEFRKDEEEVSKIILLDLYEKGIEAIESLRIYDKCPLCDESYKGNLLEHIKGKQSHLDELNNIRKKLDSDRSNLLTSIDEINKKIEDAILVLENKELGKPMTAFKDKLVKVLSHFNDCKGMLVNKIEGINKESDFVAKIDIKEYKSLLKSENKLKDKLSKQIEKFDEDISRKGLVDDFQKLNGLHHNFNKWSELNKQHDILKGIKEPFKQIKDDYTEDTKKSIQASFDAISSDLTEYFSTLEKDNKIISDPKIILISEKDKAVELEVEFAGEVIRPAYKILSESQLNSFGLSVFLASVRNFNTDFKFIILDDVINSFDAYKRPRVIELLDKYFSDWQILLLTHDSVWLDRLQQNFPNWIKKKFFGWDYALGPRVEPGKNTYEQIDEFIEKDNPTEAGRSFGVYLEWILQMLCERLEASVKYSRLNEFTLAELYQSFNERVKKKLKQNHSCVNLISNFGNDTGFRNFCAHWKDVEIPYTSSEIKEIVETWYEIENKIRCKYSRCKKFIMYEKIDGHEHISCPCRKLDLKAEEYYSKLPLTSQHN